MSDIAIEFNNVWKKFKKGERFDSLRDFIPEVAKRLFSGNHSEELREREFWALKEVSFQVKRGEAVGIIGPNGAGKSTVLKLLSRILKPNKGDIKVRGRLSALIEVGAGFHPDLTGRENVYLNGTILGMKKDEINKKFDEIVEFSGLEDFIDTPVKRYSSGMHARLGFSVAAHLDPDILVIDEVLAVGDIAFQKKCLGRMGDVVEKGRTVLFVSHNMAAVQQLTTSSILLHQGKLVASGSTDSVIDKYLNMAMEYSALYQVENTPRRFPELKREVEFLSLELEDCPTKLVPADGNIRFRIRVRCRKEIGQFRFSITLFQVDGTPVGSLFCPESSSIRESEVGTFRLELRDLNLAPGMYYCGVAIGKGNHLVGHSDFDVVLDVLHFEVMAPEGTDGMRSTWNRGWGAIRFKESLVSRLD